MTFQPNADKPVGGPFVRPVPFMIAIIFIAGLRIYVGTGNWRSNIETYQIGREFNGSGY